MSIWWLLPIAAVLGLGLLVVLGYYLPLWLQATASGARVSFASLIFMSLRRVSPTLIVRARVMAAQAGLDNLSSRELEAQYLAGGNVPRVVLALIAAHRAGIPLDWNTAAAIDLAGRDILEAVQISVNPKVIFCPVQDAGGQRTLDGVAKDGIQLNVRALITVRTNLARLIGGATEPTVIARVGQGIVSAIGACNSFRDVLADPSVMTRQLFTNGLDSQTAFTIVSVDIASIDIGENIGARLQCEQAGADIKIARSVAEQRRAMAVARTAEMHALERRYEAEFVAAEALIPPALASAMLAGRLRVPPRPRRGKESSARPASAAIRSIPSGPSALGNDPLDPSPGRPPIPVR